MHAGVAEVDVQQIGLASGQQPGQHAVFAPIDDRRLFADIFQPESTDEVRADAGAISTWEGEAFRALPLLADDERAEAAQGGHLPVNVEHFPA